VVNRDVHFCSFRNDAVLASFYDQLPDSTGHAHHRQRHLFTLLPLAQGDLLCCEACPAIFHLKCLGLGRMPADAQWFCPACVCAACGHPGFGDAVQPQCPVRKLRTGIVLIVVLQVVVLRLVAEQCWVPHCGGVLGLRPAKAFWRHMNAGCSPT